MKKRIGSQVFCLCGLLIFCVVACAQNQPVGIDTLVVTGKFDELPVAMAQTLVIEQQLPGSRADVAELLRGFNGIQADSRSNYAQDTRITLRGFGARSAFGVRGLILQVDGIPLSTADGQGQFSGVVVDGATQVSVLTGPTAALYGNASGGVINLQTTAPAVNHMSAESAIDEEGLTRQHLLGEWRDAELAVRVQASQMNADGNRPHDSAERQQLGLQTYYAFADGVQAQWRFDKEDAPLLQDPLGLTLAQWQADPDQLNASAAFFNTRKSIAHEQNALSLTQQQGNQRWQISLWQGKRSIEQYLAQKGDALASSGGVADLNRTFSGGNGNYTWDLINLPASFTLGGEWSSMNDARKGYVNNAGVAGDLRRNESDQADNRDAYLLLQWRPMADWQWLLGARHAHVQFAVDDYFIVPTQNADDSGTRVFDHTIESLATRYAFNNYISLHAAVGNGFETPTLTEMAYTNNDKGFNRTLDASNNRQQEMGVDYQRDFLSMALTAFSIRTQHELVVDQSINGRTTYRNAAATEREGVELSSNYQFTPAIAARIAFNYLDAIYTQGQYQNLSLPGVAKRNDYAQLNWRPWVNDGLKLSIDLNHRSEISTSDNNQIQAPSYCILDVAASGVVNIQHPLQLQWWLKLANATDEHYVGSVIVNQTNGRAFEPASGRNLAAGLRVDIQI